MIFIKEDKEVEESKGVKVEELCVNENPDDDGIENEKIKKYLD